MARIFDAWDSVGEPILLSHKSARPAPEVLANTSAGDASGVTLDTKARVRAVSGRDAEPGEEELHLMPGEGHYGTGGHIRV